MNRWAWSALLLAVLCSACGRDDAAPDADAASERQRDGSVTISGDDSLADSLTWRIPPVAIAEGEERDALQRAQASLEEGRLFEDADAAIPLLLELRNWPDQARAAEQALERALRRLPVEGDRALADADEDIDALRRAQRIAAVARTVRAHDEAVLAYLERVDAAEQAWQLNVDGERAFAEGRLGEDGQGALALFRAAEKARPGQARARQNIAAVESAMIRRAEIAAEAYDFTLAQRWLAHANEVRPEDDVGTVTDARGRIERLRAARIVRLRDLGLEALPRLNGVNVARGHLAELLRIARPGDPAASELRERIDLSVHYGLYGPGQVFTDALKGGGRGPQMAVVPHGAFTLGAPADEVDSSDNERPQHAIRFERGFALAIHEVTVGEFRRFIAATGHQTRAERRGYSMPYDERSNNFVRRSGVDWRSDYRGQPAADDLPVLHVSARDAAAYAEWLAAQTGHRYRLPSEAEFEYALRAGGQGRYPWGGGNPPERAGNFTGALDRSPGGRTWTHAFAGYGDGHWGPAPIGSFQPNAWGLHDLAGNVSEWVADCWHDNYRRAPGDGSAWVNPGCRDQVIRGGSWSSSPAQTRSAWRAPAQVDTTNAKVGFRVARDL
ncbi:formylglycine-generating enzyme family protein [Luteimonas aestuarii]|uniref:Formylglycine-generating enzyme family protein n=1 Tax=Luteimonas aestuarii TaxID=453837 RepID=A0A4R5TV54_9GAMM|nr:formylglycine-generating enzyme family protein [Luteimonas aestuarii]TDK24954.1 formylglycine-generating enzyme family protein [Luteimonas aestuarii]